jgi:acyl-CoA thioester hydrolase
MGTKSLDMEYEIQDADTHEVLARGITPMVSYDYTTSSSRPIPADWRKAISMFEGIPEFSEKKANG